MTTQHLWRDHALNVALRAEANYGQGLDALLSEIREQRSGCATLMLDLDRRQLDHFLHTHAVSYRSLAAGSDTYLDRAKSHAYIGWYEVKWQGNVIEIALAPSGSVEGSTVCIAEHEAPLHMFAQALQRFVIRPRGRALRYTHGWTTAEELDLEISKVSWDELVLPTETLANLRDAVEGFFNHRDAYGALGFAWRRGILLIGPPGTGKTMVCKAAAAALPDLPFLYVRDLGDYREQEAIRTIFERARALAPCILAFEDIDGLVQEGNRTVFLNELDGFQNNEGLLIIASSNHPGKIDEALLKRPSRFDRVFHLGLPALDERYRFCQRILARSALAERIDPLVDLHRLARQVAERSHGFTPAYLKEAFTSAALQRAQAGAMVLDDLFAEAVLTQVHELKQYLQRMRDPEALAEVSGRGDMPMGFRR